MAGGRTGATHRQWQPPPATGNDSTGNNGTSNNGTSNDGTSNGTSDTGQRPEWATGADDRRDTGAATEATALQRVSLGFLLGESLGGPVASVALPLCAGVPPASRCGTGP